MIGMRLRTLAIMVLATAALLAVASPAIAADGVGLWGRTTDKDITFFSLGVMGFFVILVVGLSLIQMRLEGRREREREELERLRRD